ncbi:hypothetical protein CKM354_001219700 [Cercospora kikuchii]|uniref:Uncharacterized protein n=1 Tax=Cercospora kikuchii TaxID=84275 RepID=A0A9P3FLI8_9PEZI|nr:uncharacterized protein CKM354_001219700 [Cercospora kikuchii]GIZ49161.1 hypothetical protein CKM354_001219700 [Cercospora kikuchii]
MGLFDTNGKSYYTSSSEAFLNPNAGHGSSRRGVSPARSTRSVKTSGGGGYSVRPSASNPHSHSRPTYARSASGSIFGNFGGSSSNYGGSNFGGSSRSIFNFGGGSGGSSYYKRRPRDGYISYLVHKLQRMIKELWAYARRHPVKAFFAVVVPLLSAGGAIGGLLKHFGIRMPLGMGIGGGSSRGSGGYYGSKGYGADEGGWMDALGGGAGLMGNAGSLISVAKMFM